MDIQFLYRQMCCTIQIGINFVSGNSWWPPTDPAHFLEQNVGGEMGCEASATTVVRSSTTCRWDEPWIVVDLDKKENKNKVKNFGLKRSSNPKANILNFAPDWSAFWLLVLFIASSTLKAASCSLFLSTAVPCIFSNSNAYIKFTIVWIIRHSIPCIYFLKRCDSTKSSSGAQSPRPWPWI